MSTTKSNQYGMKASQGSIRNVIFDSNATASYTSSSSSSSSASTDKIKDDIDMKPDYNVIKESFRLDGKLFMIVIIIVLK
jgi:hypothetical protein